MAGTKKAKTAAIHNLGCKVNAYEAEAMREMLEGAGYDIVDFSERADVYVVNTCTVTNIADRKSRQMIHRARALNPDAVVVAAGCYAQTSPDDARDPAIDILLGNNEKSRLVPLIEDFFKTRERTAEVIAINDGSAPYEPMRVSGTGGHTRAFIKVQDGCDMFCSYCAIPYARGRSRSRDPGDVCGEIGALARSGCREVVLDGIHLSSYSHSGIGLLGLLRLVHDIPGIARIRLGSLEPGIVTEPFVEGVRSLPKVCPHFHLSLQSGCDATLARMNRHYTVGGYGHSVGLLRDAYGHPAITTDVIAGFPGETDEEFELTYDFLERLRPYEMHIFQYSRRRGTAADRMEPQVPDQVKKERSKRLFSLERRLSAEFRGYYAGRECEVLFEENANIGGRDVIAGYTPEYVRMAIVLPPRESGSKISHIMPRPGEICRVIPGSPLSEDVISCVPADVADRGEEAEGRRKLP